MKGLNIRTTAITMFIGLAAIALGGCEEPTKAAQFWWNWWAVAATALATFLAVLAALFIEWFRYVFFPPQLDLSLVNPHGTLPLEFSYQSGLSSVARWYHVKVENRRRWARATDTQVCLIAVEEFDADDKPIRRETGAIPLNVRNEGLVRPGRVIGPNVEWDLCCVNSDSPEGGPLFALQTASEPPGLPRVKRKAFKMILDLQAQKHRKEFEGHSHPNKVGRSMGQRYRPNGPALGH
jgi:hypothetical protein